MIENVKYLLEKVNELLSDRDIRLQENQFAFNIFDICDISYDEVKVCRFICELLNPKGRHLQGNKFLKIFFKEVLKIDIQPTDEELNNAIVMREEIIRNHRRVDISISLNINDNQYYIPIEVKIFAGDQENQCYDYYQHSLKMNGNDITKARVYYLTPTGRYPSLYSANKFNPIVDENDEIVECREIETISFKEDIYRFIIACIAEFNDDRLIGEKQVLLQFKKVIEDIGGSYMGDKEDNKEIISYMSDNENIFKSAKIVRDNLQSAANIKMKEFYGLLYEKLEADDWKKENAYDTDLEYYGIKNSAWPTIYKDLVLNDVRYELVITTESNGIPFFGISLKKDEDVSKEGILIDYFKDNRRLDNGYSYGWVTWQYLPNYSEAPNFKNYNDTFYMLFNEQQTSMFVDKCVDVIKQYEKQISNA